MNPIQPEFALTTDQPLRSRTRFGMGTSFIIHTLVMLWIALHPATREEQAAITEIALIDPGTLGGGPGGDPGSDSPSIAGPSEAVPAPSDPSALAARTITRGAEQRFTRAAQVAPIAPEPQSDQASKDRVQARLAALQAASNARTSEWVATSAPQTSALWGTPASAPSTGSSPIALKRGGTGGGGGAGGTGGGGTGAGAGTGSGPALSLRRGTGSGDGTGSGSGTLTALATAGLSGGGEAASRPAVTEGVVARRTLAGASLAGPIADRPILSFVRPIYPEWAKRDGVEGSVTLDFTVLPDGRVKENVMVQKTAGFADFDANAMTALSGWRFQPLPAGKTGEQWGAITFHYRLSDAPATSR